MKFRPHSGPATEDTDIFDEHIAMAENDFDIERLAEYLHLTLPQVYRLAERGKLPGRRVGGQWKFSQAEIHHWLEAQIGLSNDAELAQMEQVLRRKVGGTDDRETSITEMLPLEAIAVPLAARTRQSVITSM